MPVKLPSDAVRLVRAAALYNAIKHGGKAEPGSVLGRVLAENPVLRPVASQLLPLSKEIVEEVNAMPPSKQVIELQKLRPELLQEGKEGKKREEEKKLPPLPNREKYGLIVTRFAPNPDSVLHLGSTRAIILSHEYARMYSGKFLLRFEDTDPRLKKTALRLYEYVIEDLKWLGCDPDEVYYQSDRLDIYYEFALKLIQLGGAYVCTCTQANFRKYISKRKACPCRSLSVEENVSRWKMMLDGSYAEGQAVLRVKTDLNHPNPAVRDWPAMRIIDTKKHRHPRVGSKYRVWPLYNWSAGLDDHLMGVTHIIRGQEHATNAVRQRYFYRAFGWTYPEAIHYGRLKIEGGELSKSKIEKGIRERKYSGYDDPRLATLRALRRRGITPAAIRRLILEVGPKPVDVTVSWDNLLAYNRQILDSTSPRHFAVFGPVPLEVLPLSDKIVRASLPRHPADPSMGTREFEIQVKNGRLTILVPSDELRENEPVRLIGLLNAVPTRQGKGWVAEFRGYSLEDGRAIGARAMQWLPEAGNVKIEVVMPNASISKGLAERYLMDEKVGTVVQFERQFFARLDSKNDIARLYFTSK